MSPKPFKESHTDKIPVNLKKEPLLEGMREIRRAGIKKRCKFQFIISCAIFSGSKGMRSV